MAINNNNERRSFINHLIFFSRIHFFSPFNSQEALDKARRNVEENYAVVGILEDLNTTFAVLEHYVPRFFKGINNIYHGLFHFVVRLFVPEIMLINVHLFFFLFFFRWFAFS